jgi:hypothetical protein
MRIRQLTILAIAFALVAAVVAGQGTDATIVRELRAGQVPDNPERPQVFDRGGSTGRSGKGAFGSVDQGHSGLQSTVALAHAERTGHDGQRPWASRDEGATTCGVAGRWVCCSS